MQMICFTEVSLQVDNRTMNEHSIFIYNYIRINDMRFVFPTNLLL